MDREDWLVPSLRSMKKEVTNSRKSKELLVMSFATELMKQNHDRGFVAGSSSPYTHRNPCGMADSMKQIQRHVS